MACYHPLDAWRHRSESKIVFSYNPKYCEGPTPDLKLPCGRCVGCRLDRSRQWAIRCMHEAQMHRDNCFITLTFAPFTWVSTRRPSDADLLYREFQLFMKRLRKRFSGVTIRFYMAGEYGENFGRPHFHACIFGLDFPDKDFLVRTPAGANIYRSKILEELWPFGYSSIGELTFESAAYVARYCMKKITGDAADLHYEHVDPETGEVFWRTPEFNKMSLRPGIGASWFEKYKTDVFPHDHIIIRGKECSVPRYYGKIYERNTMSSYVNAAGDVVEFSQLSEIKDRRVDKALLAVDDNTPERLAVKEQVALANLKKLQRKLA